ncbi:MAG: hypothetical protein JF589_15320 [Gemmatimonadetes bacterium]|nr:hypothetical protein [Gemmatimonadota bacterium]
MNTIPVGVLGASGYAGRELCALVASHPRVSLAFATANEQRGQTIRVGGRTVTFQGPDDVALDSAAVPGRMARCCASRSARQTSSPIRGAIPPRSCSPSHRSSAPESWRPAPR